jgi:uncharacterized protein YbjT (DUF2867 family)
MTSRILVTGGTGRLGRQLVPRLRAADCKLRVLSRSAHEDDDGVEWVTGDLITGAGIEAAVDGADIIVHCAGSSKPGPDRAQTENLIRAAAKTRPAHLLKVSVVGADRIPAVPVPSGVRFQPVDSRDVADRMAELALGAPAGLTPDFGGPRVYPLGDLIRSYLTARGKRRPLLPLRLPGRAARAVRDGANLVQGGTTGGRTWEDYLAERFAAGRQNVR